jgi:hypothetical protein
MDASDAGGFYVDRWLGAPGPERLPDGAGRRHESGAGQVAEIETLSARLLIDEVCLGFRP